MISRPCVGRSSAETALEWGWRCTARLLGEKPRLTGMQPDQGAGSTWWLPLNHLLVCGKCAAHKAGHIGRLSHAASGWAKDNLVSRIAWRPALHGRFAG